MHSLDTKSQFLELRAKGWSLSRIAQQIGVAKRTLVDWNAQHKLELETLRAFEEADAPTYAAIRREFVYWGDIETYFGGECVRSTGHGFCGMSRKRLLQILHARCRELGVELEFEREITDERELGSVDLVLAADGVSSTLRKKYEQHFKPTIGWGKCRFAWLGTDKPLKAFTFIFRESEHGLFAIHAYPFQAGLSTFIVECDEAVVVGYLDSVKLQFDVSNLMLVRGLNSVAIKGNFPREMFRFQRRNGFRVRPMMRSSPMATLRHPMIPDMQLNLRVLDVSIGGCALFLPNDVPALDAGVLMNGVIIDLDADTRIKTGLRLQHVTSLNPESGGVRLGCEMVTPGSDSLRALQRYIDQTQKRRRLLALD